MLNSSAAFAIIGLVNDIFKITGPTFARTGDVGNAALPVLFGRQRQSRRPHRRSRWSRSPTGPDLPDDARLRDPDGRREPECGALCRHESAPADHPDDDPVRAFAGLAGAIEILSLGYYPAVFGTTIGFAGITVALLGRANRSASLSRRCCSAPCVPVRRDADPGRDPGRDHRCHPGRDPALPGRRDRGQAGLPVRAGTGTPDELGTSFKRSPAATAKRCADGFLDIPVLGFIFQFLVYLVNAILNTNLAPQILGLATPIALGALCGVMNERSGVVNIGIEGMMLLAAFVGFMAAVSSVQCLPDAEPSAFFGVTPALLVGVLAAIGAGMLVPLLHAWLSISMRADQIISGTIINIIALGLTSYLNRLIKPCDSAGPSIRSGRRRP